MDDNKYTPQFNYNDDDKSEYTYTDTCKDCGKVSVSLMNGLCFECRRKSQSEINRISKSKKSTSMFVSDCIFILALLLSVFLLFQGLDIEFEESGDKSDSTSTSTSSATSTSDSETSLLDIYKWANNKNSYVDNSASEEYDSSEYIPSIYSNPQENPSQSAIEPTVYITETGEKYHTASCGSLWNSSYSTTPSEAFRMGYTPCARCNPPLPEDF